MFIVRINRIKLVLLLIFAIPLSFGCGSRGDFSTSNTTSNTNNGGWFVDVPDTPSNNPAEDGGGKIPEDEGGSGVPNGSGAGGGEKADDVCKNASPISITGPGDISYEFGEKVDIEYKVTGGSGRYRWYHSGSLPKGVRFENGILKGSPEEIGEFGFRIKAKDRRCNENLVAPGILDVKMFVYAKEISYQPPSSWVDHFTRGINNKGKEISSSYWFWLGTGGTPIKGFPTQYHDLYIEFTTAKKADGGAGKPQFIPSWYLDSLCVDRWNASYAVSGSKTIFDLGNNLKMICESGEVTSPNLIVELGNFRVDQGRYRLFYKVTYTPLDYSYTDFAEVAKGFKYSFRYNSNDPWLIQSVKIVVDNKKIIYYNPCFLEWAVKDKQIDIVPNNESVLCVVPTVGDDPTDDTVVMLFPFSEYPVYSSGPRNDASNMLLGHSGLGGCGFYYPRVDGPGLLVGYYYSPFPGTMCHYNDYCDLSCSSNHQTSIDCLTGSDPKVDYLCSCILSNDKGIGYGSLGGTILFLDWNNYNDFESGFVTPYGFRLKGPHLFSEAAIAEARMALCDSPADFFCQHCEINDFSLNGLRVYSIIPTGVEDEYSKTCNPDTLDGCVYRLDSCREYSYKSDKDDPDNRPVIRIGDDNGHKPGFPFKLGDMCAGGLTDITSNVSTWNPR